MPCVCRLRTESVDKKRMASALYGTRAGLIPVVRFRGVRAALVHFIDPCSRALARLAHVVLIRARFAISLPYSQS